MNKILKITFGMLLIALGIIGILDSYNIVHLSFFSLWTYVLLVLGIILEAGYFSSARRSPGLLIAGGTIMVIGGMFVVASLISWQLMADIWPLMILAPGFGFLQSYVIHAKDKGHLISALVLIAISILFFNVTLFGLDSYILISAALIILGGYLIFKPSKKTVEKL